MKKIVSLALAGLMSLSLFAIGASADSIEHGKTTTVVGADAGVQPDDWTDSTDSSSDINVKVDKVIHKYAVDITFNLNDLTLGDITWNVTDMKYEFADDFGGKKSQTIKLDNRSDLAVYAYATVNQTENANNSGLKITVGDNVSADNKLEVLKATAGTGNENGKATSGILNITLDADTENGKTWADVAAYFANLKIEEENAKDFASLVTDGKNTASTYKIATITVTLSKSAN